MSQQTYFFYPAIAQTNVKHLQDLPLFSKFIYCRTRCYDEEALLKIHGFPVMHD